MEVISLASPADWEWRPGFHADLVASHDALDRIVGKYDLARPPPGSPAGIGMVLCGLNGCHTKHYVGFLIRLKDGRETIIGQDCGAREFRTTWSDVHAVFRAAQRLHEVQQVVQGLRHARDAMISRAQGMLPDCEKAHVALAAVRDKFHRHQGFWGHLYSVSRNDGRVTGRALDDEGKPILRGGKEITETKAVSKECALLLDDNTSVHARALKFKVIAWLTNDLDRDISSAGTDLKMLASIAKKAGELEDYLKRAEEFIAQSHALLVPGNLAQLAAVEQHLLSRHQKSSALSRALRQLERAAQASRQDE